MIASRANSKFGEIVQRVTRWNQRTEALKLSRQRTTHPEVDDTESPAHRHAVTNYARPYGAPAMTTHDVQNTGAEQCTADLDIEATLYRLADFQMRATENFVRHAERMRELERRITSLETDVNHKDQVIASQARTILDMQTHLDRMANTLTPITLASERLLALVRN